MGASSNNVNCIFSFLPIITGPSTSSESSMDGPSKVTLVFFVGGCTHAEISALRFLARQENSECAWNVLFLLFVFLCLKC